MDGRVSHRTLETSEAAEGAVSIFTREGSTESPPHWRPVALMLLGCIQALTVDKGHQRSP